jgi:hypothetical protein
MAPGKQLFYSSLYISLTLTPALFIAPLTTITASICGGSTQGTAKIDYKFRLSRNAMEGGGTTVGDE